MYCIWPNFSFVKPSLTISFSIQTCFEWFICSTEICQIFLPYETIKKTEVLSASLSLRHADITADSSLSVEHIARKPVTWQTHGFPIPTLGEAGGYRPIQTAPKETRHQQREMAALHSLWKAGAQTKEAAGLWHTSPMTEPQLTPF